MEFSEIIGHILEHIIMPDTFSRGIIWADSQYIEPLLAALPGTHLDLYYCKNDDIEHIKAHDRITLVSLSETFPKYLTRLYRDRCFYDYFIVDGLHGELPRMLGYIWSRIRVGGVLISDHNIFKNRPPHQMIMTKMKWIIIMAASRGASRYIYNVASKVKLNIYHEHYGPRGMVAGPVMGNIVLPKTIILHQVREPLVSISSLAVRASAFSPLYSDLIGVKYTDDRILWAMHYWYKVHRMADAATKFTYRVEALPDIWNKWCDCVQIPLVNMPDVSTRSNSHPIHLGEYPEVTWDILKVKDITLTAKIRELAEYYGYQY